MNKSDATSEREKKIEELKNRLKLKQKIEAKAHKFVQYMSMKKSVNEEQLSKMCQVLSPDQYDDVVEERTLSSFCGYPLCHVTLVNTPRKKYHISRSNSTVYDIELRKKFCSNKCYLASNHLKGQIPNAPLFMRDSNEIQFNFLKDPSKFKLHDGLGEVVLQPPGQLLAEEVCKMKLEDGDDDNDGLGAADGGTHGDGGGDGGENEYQHFNDNDDEKIYDDDDDDDDDGIRIKDRNQKSHKNQNTDGNMMDTNLGDVEGRRGLQQDVSSYSDPLTYLDNMYLKIHGCFLDWRTDTTYLFHGGDDDDDDDDDTGRSDNDVDKECVKVNLKRADCDKEYDNTTTNNNNNDDDDVIILPPSDHKNIMAIRRNIVIERLSIVMRKLSEILKSSITMLMKQVKSIISTFNFTNMNIILKPLEWMTVGWVLLHIFATKDKDLSAKLNNSDINDTFLTKFKINKQQIEQTVSIVLSKPTAYH